MKKLCFLSFLLFFVTSTIAAQTVEELQSAIVYYMPATTIEVNVQYEEIHYTPGIFYQYAEKYLGIKKIKTRPEHCFRLSDVNLLPPQTSADTTRAFTANLDKLPLLVLSPDKRIISIGNGQTVLNTDSAKKNICHKSKPCKPESCLNDTEKPLLMLQEAQLLANSTAKMAEGAAKQIYHLREARTALITADNDTPIQDGEALKIMLREIDQQEKALTELFIGQQKVVKHQATISFYPTETITDSVLFRFSEQKGIVKFDDLSGEPVYISLRAHKQMLRESSNKKNGKRPAFSELYFNNAGWADVEIFTLDRTLVEPQTIGVAQFGVSIPLTEKFISQAKKIILNPQTGDIMYIEK